MVGWGGDKKENNKIVKKNLDWIKEKAKKELSMEMERLNLKKWKVPNKENKEILKRLNENEIKQRRKEVREIKKN